MDWKGSKRGAREAEGNEGHDSRTIGGDSTRSESNGSVGACSEREGGTAVCVLSIEV